MPQQRPPQLVSPKPQHMPCTHCWLALQMLVPQAVAPAAAHCPSRHCWPCSQHLPPHTTRVASQHTLLLHCWPGLHTAVPQGVEPAATHWFCRQILLLLQQTPPQTCTSSGQQLKPSKQRQPAGQAPPPHRVLPGAATDTPAMHTSMTCCYFFLHVYTKALYALRQQQQQSI
jgi:hypothetical protein